MRYWVVKGNPKRNNWNEMLVPGRHDKWYARHRPKDASKGDRVFFWESSPKLRLIAVGHVTDPDTGIVENGEESFELEYLTRRLGSPLTIDRLRRIPVLRDASFLKPGPSGTVFPLTDAQAEAILELLVETNSDVSRVWSDAEPEVEFPSSPRDVQVLSVPAGGTSELIEIHRIHACPESYNYARPHSHLTCRQTGGAMDFVYRIESTYVFDPAGPVHPEIRGRVLARVKSYVNDRDRSFGFGEGGPFRFYVLSESEVIPLHRRPSLPRRQGHAYFSLAELVGQVPNSTLEFQKDLPERLSPRDADLDFGDGTDEGPVGLTDTRELVTRELRARRGQVAFRNALCRIYRDRCVVTGCDLLDILEAAHIAPYRGEDCNHTSNGLLLRADIHTLFDLSLLGIDPSSLTVALHPRAQVDGYRHLEGSKIACGSATLNRRSLEDRWQLFLEKLQDQGS